MKNNTVLSSNFQGPVLFVFRHFYPFPFLLEFINNENSKLTAKRIQNYSKECFNYQRVELSKSIEVKTKQFVWNCCRCCFCGYRSSSSYVTWKNARRREGEGVFNLGSQSIGCSKKMKFIWRNFYCGKLIVFS